MSSFTQLSLVLSEISSTLASILVVRVLGFHAQFYENIDQGAKAFKERITSQRVFLLNIITSSIRRVQMSGVKQDSTHFGENIK